MSRTFAMLKVWQEKWFSNFISLNIWLNSHSPLRSTKQDPSMLLASHYTVVFSMPQKSSRVTSTAGHLNGSYSHSTFDWRLEGWVKSHYPHNLSECQSTWQDLKKWFPKANSETLNSTYTLEESRNGRFRPGFGRWGLWACCSISHCSLTSQWVRGVLGEPLERV